MSWDLYIMDLPAGAVTVDDIPKDFAPTSLGTRAELITKILEVAPSANFSDESWGRIEHPDFSIEISMGREDAVDSIALHVRGADTAIAVVAEVLSHLKLRAFDPQSPTGALFSPAKAIAGFHAWQKFRDSVVNKPPHP